MGKKVCVLMSTYNGEKYIEEQIHSILEQKGNFELTLLIRDDGSSDLTRQILEQYSNKNCNVLWYAGKNLGSTWSFFKLVDDAPEADYYAFSDQDDYWLPNKINEALRILYKNEDIPVLYSGKKRIVDKYLKDIAQNDVEPEKGLLNALFKRNKASGCTMVFNQAMRELLMTHKVSQRNEAIYHDSWAFKLAEIYGKNIFDNNAYILYRQHDNNVAGAIFTSYKAILHKIYDRGLKRIVENKTPSIYARELLKTYDYRGEKNYIEILDCVANGHGVIKKRIRLMFLPGLTNNSLYEYVGAKIKILCGWF